MSRLLRRNTIGQVRKLVIERTVRCKYGSGHYYNASVERSTEMHADALSSAIDYDR